MSENLNDDDEWDRIVIDLPPELKGYEEDLTRFFDGMIYKLRRNSHKGKWESLSMPSALKGLKDEMVELHTSIKHGNTLEILTEAFDVANMALITASLAVSFGRKE